jgi:hypothetical protein
LKSRRFLVKEAGLEIGLFLLLYVQTCQAFGDAIKPCRACHAIAWFLLSLKILPQTSKVIHPRYLFPLFAKKQSFSALPIEMRFFVERGLGGES